MLKGNNGQNITLLEALEAEPVAVFGEAKVLPSVLGPNCDCDYWKQPANMRIPLGQKLQVEEAAREYSGRLD